MARPRIPASLAILAVILASSLAVTGAASGDAIHHGSGIPFFLLNGNLTVIGYRVKPCTTVFSAPFFSADYNHSIIEVGYRIRYGCAKTGVGVERVNKIGDEVTVLIGYNVSDEYWIPLTLYAHRVDILIARKSDGIHLVFRLIGISAGPTASTLRQLAGVNISDKTLPHSITISYLVDPANGDTWLVSGSNKLYLGKNPLCIPWSLGAGETGAQARAYAMYCGDYIGLPVHMYPSIAVMISLPRGREWRIVDTIYSPDYEALKTYNESLLASLFYRLARGDNGAAHELRAILPRLFHGEAAYRPSLYIEGPSGEAIGYVKLPLNESLDTALILPLALDANTSKRLFGAKYIVLDILSPKAREMLGTEVSLTITPGRLLEETPSKQNTSAKAPLGAQEEAPARTSAHVSVHARARGQSASTLVTEEATGSRDASRGHDGSRGWIVAILLSAAVLALLYIAWARLRRGGL